MLMDVRQSRLGNGIRVVTASMPHVESVSIGLWFGAGSRHEAAAEAGISHFLEHLLFKGTRRRSARQISVAIEGRGGYLDAFTQEESTCYYARVARDQFDRTVDVLADMVLNARLAGRDVEKERGVIVEEILMYRDQPAHVVQERLTAALWQGHALGRSIAGSPETLARLGQRKIRAYKERAYRPGDLVVAAAGRIDHAACVRAVEQRMAGWRAGRGLVCRADGDRAPQEAIALQTRDIEQTHLAMGFRLFGRSDRRRYALRVLNTVLGESMSSRLFQEVRERRGLAYAIQSTFQLFLESGALFVSAGLDRRRWPQAVGLILNELGRLKREAPNPREMKLAREYIIGQLKLGLESTTHQMMWMGENLLSYGRFVSPEEMIEEILSVTAADVRNIAREFFHSGAASVAMISPGLSPKDEAGLAREIRRLG
jgi:predicted Zn-dependent peptidase